MSKHSISIPHNLVIVLSSTPLKYIYPLLHIQLDSIFFIRNCATINLYKSISGTMKSFEFYPICKLTSWSAIVSWILADVSEANNFITARSLGISIFEPIPLVSHF